MGDLPQRRPGRYQKSDLLYFPHDDPSAVLPLVDSPLNERAPAISPDGRWLAYTSDDSGQDEVHVRPFPGPGGRVQVSVAGGAEPIWARNGRELFYRSGSSVITAVLGREATFRILSRQTLMPGGAYNYNGNHAHNDGVPGDTTFTFVRTGGDVAQMVLVANWLDELRTRGAK